jgi:hypothetical protein
VNKGRKTVSPNPIQTYRQGLYFHIPIDAPEHCGYFLREEKQARKQNKKKQKGTGDKNDLLSRAPASILHSTLVLPPRSGSVSWNQRAKSAMPSPSAKTYHFTLPIPVNYAPKRELSANFTEFHRPPQPSIFPFPLGGGRETYFCTVPVNHAGRKCRHPRPVPLWRVLIDNNIFTHAHVKSARFKGFFNFPEGATWIDGALCLPVCHWSVPPWVVSLVNLTSTPLFISRGGEEHISPHHTVCSFHLSLIGRYYIMSVEGSMKAVHKLSPAVTTVVCPYCTAQC